MRFWTIFSVWILAYGVGTKSNEKEVGYTHNITPLLRLWTHIVWQIYGIAHRSHSWVRLLMTPLPQQPVPQPSLVLRGQTYLQQKEASNLVLTWFLYVRQQRVWCLQQQSLSTQFWLATRSNGNSLDCFGGLGAFHGKELVGVSHTWHCSFTVWLWLDCDLFDYRWYPVLLGLW